MNNPDSPAQAPEIPSEEASAWSRPDTKAFDTWQAGLRDNKGRLLSEHTLRQRRAMFGKFQRFLIGQGMTVFTAGASEIESFLLNLTTRVPTGEPKAARVGEAFNDTRLRYARLIRDTMAHLVELGLRQRNAAAALVPQFELQRGETRFTLPSCLDRLQDTRLRLYMEAMPTEPWTANRFRALLFIFAGTGLTLNEAITLHVENVDLENARLQTTGSPDKRAHDIPLAEWCIEPLKDWLRQLLELLPEPRYLFASSTGGRTGEAVHLIDEPLAENSVYLAVSAALTAIGYRGDKGPTVLRNTYALRNLARGMDRTVLRGYMGLETDYQLWKIAKRLALWVEPERHPV